MGVSGWVYPSRNKLTEAANVFLRLYRLAKMGCSQMLGLWRLGEVLLTVK